MDNKVPLNDATPPPYQAPYPPMAMGGGASHIQNPPYSTVYNGPPQPMGPTYNTNPMAPPPLNAYNMAPGAAQVTYTTTPLVQQPTIAAVNSTPRYYNPPVRGYGFGSRDRKFMYIGLIIYGVVFVVILVVFLTVFFTVFNKVSSEIDEAKQRHEDFKKEHFSNW